MTYIRYLTAICILFNWTLVCFVQYVIQANLTVNHQKSLLLYLSGSRLNIMTVFSRYDDSHAKDKMVARPSCLVHPGVRNKRQVSQIDSSQPRHETAFWWRHNGPVTSQLTDSIKWPDYPLELIGIYVHINTHNKESMTQGCRRTTNVQMCLVFLCISIYLYGLSFNGWHAYLASQITDTTSP